MKPKLKHKMYGNGIRLCGDTTKNIYITDKEYSLLLECPNCFGSLMPPHRALSTPQSMNGKENTVVETITPRKRFLRDYLINSH